MKATGSRIAEKIFFLLAKLAAVDSPSPMAAASTGDVRKYAGSSFSMAARGADDLAEPREGRTLNGWSLISAPRSPDRGSPRARKLGA